MADILKCNKLFDNVDVDSLSNWTLIMEHFGFLNKFYQKVGEFIFNRLAHCQHFIGMQ